MAAGYTPVDLNNLFIGSKEPQKYIDKAEKDGFPKSLCAWIKGIYGVCISENIEAIVGVIEGDCSNTKALIEVLKLKGIKVYPFAFPQSHTVEAVEREIKKFINYFETTEEKVEEIRRCLIPVRSLARQIDELTFIENKASGFENHLYQVSLSDFDGDVKRFEMKLKNIALEIKERKPEEKTLRLGYIGVPPMTGDLYRFVENFNASFVYNEVQREFAFPRGDKAQNIFEQYYDYTYPYGIEFRIEELKKQIKERKLDAVVHYTQAFCYRAIDDIVLKKQLDLPMLTIEGDKSNFLDARTKLRIEAFLDMLLDLKEEGA